MTLIIAIDIDSLGFPILILTSEI